MKTLDDARIEIDKIDSEIIELLEKRNTFVEDVIEYKISNNMDILDSSREAMILEKVESKVKNDQYSEYVKNVFQTIMDESKKYQDKILKDFTDKGKK